MGGVLILLVLIAIYFAPAINGYRKRNFPAILTLNLFLGWTFVGWVIALVWSYMAEA